ncbi:MAG: ABC transporter ATP-binding protein [Paracoccaceae bacterium]|tara:strand:+ start:13138 stop:14889 length:1752 start_codon:yes stop_codon:yes gene_type:complete
MELGHTPTGDDAFQTAKRLVRETIPKRKKIITASVLCMVGVSVFTAALAYTTKLIVNDVFVAKDASAAIEVAIIVIFVSFSKSLFHYGNAVLQNVLNRSISSSYQKETFENTLRREISFFNGKHASDHMAQIRLYGMAAGQAVTVICSRFLTEVLTLIALFFVMFLQDALMTFYSILIIPLIFGLVSFLSRKIRKVAKEEADLSGQYFAAGSEALAGVRTVKSYNLENKSIEKFNSSVDALEDRIFGISKVTAATHPIMEFLGGLVLGVFVIYAAWQTINYGKTPGEFTAFITAFLLAYQPAAKISKLWVELQKSLTQSFFMFLLIDTRPQLLGMGNKSLKTIGGSVTFSDVSFGYENDDVSINKVSFNLSPGEKVAIVGKSGAGKSTLIDLILGFYRPDKGKIEIGSIDISSILPVDLKSHIAFISQDVFLFDDTIEENIKDGFSDASKAEINIAVKNAQVDSFVADFPLGLQTIVGANGSNLSGGQKQRVAIARGLLKKASIYIFDEATSALDLENEREILTALLKTLENETVIFVSHRPALFDYVDKVLMLEKGKVVGFDQPSKIDKTSTEFRDLFGVLE